MPDASKMVDGAGVAAVWNGIEEYVEAKAADIASILPTPRVSVTYADDHESAVIKVMNTWTGYGDVVVRCKLGGEPTEADTVVGASGLSVDYTSNGRMFVRAFPSTGNNNTASGSSIVAINGLKEPPKVFAVQWNYGNSSPALTRLTPSSDPLGVVTETINTEPVPEITGTRAGSSPFDAYDQLYGAIKRRNFESNGTPGAWEGESGFTLTDKDVMVWIPQFWYKIVNDASANKRRYYVSTGAIEGFKLHPGSGQYVAAYETSSNNQSRSGKTVQVSQTRATFRTNARAKGAGWQLCDAAERNAINLLYLIEFADTNCQAKIGAGRSSASSALQTGTTDVMTYHTGRPSGTEASVGVKYRGMENLWGNVYEWTDGANFINRVPYYSTDRDSYADDTTAGYTACGGQNPGDGYITKQRYVEALDWCISQPDAVGGSETTYFPDYHYYNSGNRILAVGGHWNGGGDCGLFCWLCISVSSYSLSLYGSRLSYKDPSGGGSDLMDMPMPTISIGSYLSVNNPQDFAGISGLQIQVYSNGSDVAYEVCTMDEDGTLTPSVSPTGHNNLEVIAIAPGYKASEPYSIILQTEGSGGRG